MVARAIGAMDGVAHAEPPEYVRAGAAERVGFSESRDVVGALDELDRAEAVPEHARRVLVRRLPLPDWAMVFATPALSAGQCRSTPCRADTCVFDLTIGIHVRIHQMISGSSYPAAHNLDSHTQTDRIKQVSRSITATQAVSCGLTISFFPLTLSSFIRASPSTMPANPPDRTSTGFGCISVRGARSTDTSNWDTVP
jgi:hypothetical protein